MRYRARAVLGLLVVALVGSCVSRDSPTGVGGRVPAGIVFQPALIPSPADGSALPINRVRAVTARVPDNVVLSDTVITVQPTAPNWSLDLRLSLPGSPTRALTFVYLMHETTAGTRSVEFSGRTDTLTLVSGQTTQAGDLPLVRGPIGNLFATGVTITNTANVVVLGGSLGLTADVQSSSATATARVFWTSLDTMVVRIDTATARGVALGTAAVVASAGAFSDTTTLTVLPPPVDSVEVSPNTANVLVGQTRAYTVRVLDVANNVLTGRVVRWSTASSAVATVDSITGVVTAVAPGTTTVRATSEGVFDDAAVVVVPVPVRSVVVSPDSAVVAVGGTTTYTAQTRDSIGGLLTGRVVTWTTGSTSIATVGSSSGVVTGVAAGTTTVRATSEGVFDEATVRVTAAAPGGATNSWTRGANGNWSDPTAWSLGRAPQPGDTVLLTQGSGYTVTLDVNATILDLVVGGTTGLTTLDVGDRALTITDSGIGDELHVGAFGRLLLGNASVDVIDIRNDGVIRVVGTSSLVVANVLNSGSFEVPSGGIVSFSHVSGSDIRTEGSVSIGAGAVALFVSADLTYLGGSITGAGQMTFGSGSTLALEANLVLDGPHVLLVDASTQAIGGDRLTIGPTSTLSLVSQTTDVTLGTKLVVQGEMFVQGPDNFLLDSLYVAATGSLVVNDGGVDAQLTTMAVDNSGLIVITGAGGGVTAFGSRSPSHSIVNRSTGIIEVFPGAERYLVGEFINEGTITIRTFVVMWRRNDLSQYIEVQHENSGTIEILQGGELDVYLSPSSTSFLRNTGVITLEDSSSLGFVGVIGGPSSLINEASGVLRGEGTVRLSGAATAVNHGSIAPGQSPGTLNWLGSLPMGPTGTIEIELEGLTPGTGYDRIAVSGALTLGGNGTLQVTAPSFTPSVGNRFAVLTFASRSGTFGTVNLPVVPGVALDTLWVDGGAVDTLVLVASAAAAPPLNRWLNGVSGIWSIPGNWSRGSVPAAGDSVVIDVAGTYTVMMDVGSTAVARLVVGGASGTQTLDLPVGRILTLNGPGLVQTSGALTVTNAVIAGSGTLTSRGVLTASSATIGTPLVNEGTLVLRLATSMSSTLATVPGSVIRVEGVGGFSDANVIMGNGFTNNGRIELTSISGSADAALFVTAGTLVNAAGATIEAMPGTGGARTLSAALNNQGTLLVSVPLTMNRSNSAYTNSGTIAIDTNLTLNQSGTPSSFTNTGTVTIASGRTWTVSSGTLNQNAGTIGGAGTLSLLNATANFATPFSNASTALALSGGAFNGPGTLTNAGGQTLTVVGSIIGAPLANEGTLVLRAGVSLNGAVTTVPGSVMRVEGVGSLSAAAVTVATGFVNNARIELTSSGPGGASSSLAVDAGALVNAAGATIEVMPGTGGTRTLSAGLNNQGTFLVSAPLTMNGLNAAHANAGTIDVDADLSLFQGGTPSTFTNTGTVTIPSGRTWLVSGGTLNQSTGTIGGAGTLSLANTTANFTTAFTNATTGLALVGTTFNGPGALTNAVGQTLTATGSTIGAPLVNEGTLVLRAGVSINGLVTTVAGSVLRVEGVAGVSAADVTVANGFVNNARIELTSSGAGGAAAGLAVTAGTLENASGGTIESMPGTGGARTLAVALDNDGTFLVSAPLTMNRANSAHSNSSTFAINADLTLTQGGTPQSFTNTGTMTIASIQTLIVNGGTLNQSAGTFGGGTLLLQGTTANFTTPFTTASTTLSLSNGAFNGPGVLTNALGQTLSVVSSTIGAPLVNQGTLVFLAGNTLSGALATAAGSILRVQGFASFSDATLTVSNGFVNNGRIELTSTDAGGAASTLTVLGLLENEVGGTIESMVGTGGARSLAAQLDNVGTFLVNQPLALSGTLDHVDGAVLGGGASLDLTSALVQSFGGNVSPGASAGAFSMVLPAGGLDVGPLTTFSMELNGTTPGVSYDRFSINGELILDGNLVVLDTTAFTPAVGNRFAIMTFGSRTGTFANVSLPSVAGVAFDTVWVDGGAVDTLVIQASAAIPPILNSWTNPAGGSWGLGTNWSSGVPVSGDSVVIDLPGTYTVTLSQAAQVAYLIVGGASGTQTLSQTTNTLTINTASVFGVNGVYAMANGTLAGAGAVTIEGQLNWTQGTMTGSGTTRTLGPTSFVGASGKNLAGGRTFRNAGTLTWTDGLIAFTGGAAFINETGALVTINGGLGTSAGAGGGSFLNEGTITRSGGTTAISLGTGGSFTNNGLLDVQSRRVNVTGSGSMSHGGNFTVSAGDTLGWTAASHTIFGNITGGGSVQFAATNVVVNGAYTSPSIVVTSGSTIFATTSTITITDTVRVGGGTLTFNSGEPLVVPSYAQSGGTRNGTDSLEVTGAFTWSGGTVGGTGAMRIAPSVTGATMSGPAQKIIRDGVRVRSAAPMNWSDGEMAFLLAGQFINETGATLTINGGLGTSAGAGGGSFLNEGTIIRSGGVTAISLGTGGTFTNNGLLDVQSRRVNVSGSTPVSHSGNFTVSAGDTLAWTAGSHTVLGNITGGGSVQFLATSVTVSGAYTSPSVVVTSGSTTFSAASTITITDTVRVGAGTLTFNSGELLVVPSYVQSAGTRNGTDSLDVTSTFIWSGGTVGGTGAMRIAPSVTGAAMTGSGQKIIRDGVRVRNAASMTWADGQMAFLLAGQFVNELGATLTITGGLGTFDGAGGGTLTNNGTIVRTGGTAAIELGSGGSNFVNNGLLDVESRRVNLDGVGPATHTGDFTVTAGDTLAWTGGTHTINGDVTGAGSVQFVSSGTMTVNGTYSTPSLIATGPAVTFAAPSTFTITDTLRVTAGTATFNTGETVVVPSLVQSAGTLAGSDSIDVTGRFSWSGGTITGSHAVRLAPTVTNATMSIGSKTLTGAARFRNATTLTWTAGQITLGGGAFFANAAGATFDIAGDGDFAAITGNGSILNDGLVLKSAGGASLFASTTPFTNSGTMQIGSGLTLDFAGTFTHSDGAVLRGAGTLDLAAVGAGGFAGDVNPGTSPGILSIVSPSGGLTLAAPSALNLELNGTTAGTGYDRLAVSGALTLGGSLTVLDTTSFVPQAGDRYAVLTTSSRAGNFASVTLPTVPGVALDTVWATAGTVDTLFVIASAGASPLNSWQAAVSGNWGFAGNWSRGTVPVSTDSVVIDLPGTYTITLDTNASAGSLTLGGAAGLQLISVPPTRTLTLSGPSTSVISTNGRMVVEGAVNGTGAINNAGVTTLIAGTIANSLANSGTLIGSGSANVSGQITTTSTSLIQLGQVNGSQSTAALTVASGFTNNGAIVLSNLTALGPYDALLTVTAGTLTNAPGASIATAAGTLGGGSRTLSARVANSGSITTATGHPLVWTGPSGAVHTNAGLIDATNANVSLTMTGGGTLLTNTGTITVPSGRTLSITGGVFTHPVGGTLSGGGAFALASTTAQLQTGFTLSALSATGSNVSVATGVSTASLSLSLVGSTLGGTGSLTNSSGQTLTLNGTTIDIPVTNEGVLIASGSSAVNGGLVTASGSTIRVGQVDGSTSMANLTVAGGLTNNGAIELTNLTTLGAYDSQLMVTGGALTNNVGATITTAAGSSGGGSRLLNATLSNQGSVTPGTGHPLLWNTPTGATHTNSGSINASAADVFLAMNVTASLTNPGTIALASGRALAIQGGTFTLPVGGTLNGGGALVLGGGATASLAANFTLGSLTATGATVTIASGVSTASLTMTFSGVTVNGTGSILNSAGRTLTMTSSTVNVPVSNQGILVASGTVSLLGAVTTAGGSIMRVGQLDGAVSQATLGFGSGFTNNGAIEITNLTPLGAYGSRLLIAGGGTLTNQGTITTLGGLNPGGLREIGANVINEGTLTVVPAGAGTLTMTGSLTNATTGTLALEIGGLTAGTQYDRIAMTGAASLAGTLDVDLFGGFEPVTANAFSLLTYGSLSGDFDDTELPVLSSGDDWLPAANPTSYTLTVIP